MKRLLYSAAVLAMAFFAASCQQESLEPVVGSNTVTYTVQVPDALATKGIGDDVSAVTELVYEVYRTEAVTADDHSKAETKLYQKTATISGGVATVELELVNNQNFRVLFWAQDPDNTVYTTDDLKNVTLSQNLVANTEDYAAFAGSDFIKDGDPLTGRTISLVRPVAQLNIATSNDGLDIEGQTTVAITNTAVTVTGLSTTFNVAEGKAGSDAVAFEYAANPALTGNLVVSGETYRYLSMNYLGFAGARRNVVVDYTIETSNVGTITNTINNVPVEPNYRTNIVGNLITSVSDYTVTLDAEWGTPEEEVEVWDGKMLSAPSYNTQTKTWSVTKASELAWLAAAVNGDVTVTRAGDTFSTDNVVLTADIDLGNYPWTPIGLTGDQAGFQGTFDGQGHTISNLYVDLTKNRTHQSAGLFGSARGTIKDFTVRNATIKNLDIIGSATSSGSAVIVGASQHGAVIEDVHVVNAVVSSNRKAAGIAGYFKGTITGCTVENATITVTPDLLESGKYDNGDKVGGIMAYSNGGVTLTGNTVKNFTVKGYRDAGGVAGYAQSGDNVSDNTVIDGSVVLDRNYDYCENKGKTAGAILGFGTPGENTITNVAVANSEDSADSNSDFTTALANVADGGVVAVSGEITTTSLNVPGKSITIVGTTENAVLNSSADRLNTSGNITFKNITITLPTTGDYYKGHNAQGGTLLFENCKFYGCVCVMNADVTYNNCEFTNPDKYAAWVYSGKATYNDCTFTGPDRAVKVYAENANAPVVYYNNCTFKATTKVNKAAVEVDCQTRTSGTPYYVEINNPTIENMGISDAYSIGNGVCNLKTEGVGLGIVNLNGESYSVASTATQLQALTNAGRDVTIELLNDINGDFTYTQDDNENVVIDGKNHQMTGTVKVQAASDHNSTSTMFVIKNINFTTTDVERDFINAGASNHYPHLTVSNCTFVGSGADKDVIPVRLKDSKYCVIENCIASNIHSFINNTAGWDLTIRNCEVTNAGRGISLGTCQGVLIENVRIEASNEKYGIRMDANTYNGPVTIKNCNVSAFIPVVVRDANAPDYKLIFEGTNTMTAANTDGLWCAIGGDRKTGGEYEQNGVMPTAPTGKVTVILNDTGLDASGVYGASNL